MKTLAFSSELQVRKDERNELPFLVGFRTLEQLLGSPRSHGNQTFQRCPIFVVPLLVLLDASGDLGLLSL
jgi:hypothetical protein